TLEFDQEGRELVAGADLVCFPMGSFHTSVLANLLPRGVGRAVADRCCPKVFVPGLGADPELPGVGVADQVAMLLKRLRDDAGDRPVSELLTHVLLDAEDAGYGREVEAARIAALGVEVLRMPLVEVRPAGPRIDARRLAEVLVTMGG
ncbi:MAG: 2-phospho-L-lactate transferase CofD family protein, partial [Planctomycetota bacterium]